MDNFRAKYKQSGYKCWSKIITTYPKMSQLSNLNQNYSENLEVEFLQKV